MGDSLAARDLTVLSDEELVQDILEGDAAAETEVVRRFAHGVRIVLERRLGDRSLAEDLCQETFIILIKRLRVRSLDEPSQLARFVHRIAVNLARDENRKSARRATDTDDEIGIRIAASEPGPGQLLDRDIERKQVRELMESLGKERDREILRKFYIEELDKSEICEALGLSLRHFDRVLFRAKDRFRKLYFGSASILGETEAKAVSDD